MEMCNSVLTDMIIQVSSLKGGIILTAEPE